MTGFQTGFKLGSDPMQMVTRGAGGVSSHETLLAVVCNEFDCFHWNSNFVVIVHCIGIPNIARTLVMSTLMYS